MTAEILVLCDNAQNHNNKLIVVGAFNTIYANELPGMYTFSLASRFSFHEEDSPGEKKIKIEFLDEKGNSFMPLLEAKTDVLEKKEYPQIANIVINFGNVQFNNYGTFRIKVSVDNFSRDLHLYVRKATEDITPTIQG